MKNFKYGAPCTEIKDINLKDRIVQAYYYDSQQPDSDNDLLNTGLYGKSIAERGPKSAYPRIKHLFNHWDGAGVVQELGEDTQGGWFISKLGRHTVGRDTLLMYEDGLITEHSHGLEVTDSENITKDGKDIRSIKEAVLWEVTSLDKWGAQMNTPVMKSLEDRNYWTKRLDVMIKSFANGKYTDETFELLEVQLTQIKEMIRLFDKPEQLPTPLGAGGQPTSIESILDKVKY